MRVDLRSEYFEDLERNFPEEYALAEYQSRLVTIDEMRNLLIKRSEKSSTQNIVDLKLDNQTGLYHAEHSFLDCNDLLSNHLFAEQLFAKKDKVDWKGMTDCYDYKVLQKINFLLSYPLVWLPPYDIRDDYVVVGDVAAEITPPDSYYFRDGRYGFYDEMRLKGLLWFADTMPTKNDVYDDFRYDDIPDTMVLWDRFLFGGYHDIRTSLDHIVAHGRVAKAVKIVERFRKEWDWFVAVNFDDFQQLDDDDKERYRKELFEEIEPYLYSWKIKAQDIDTLKKQSKTDCQLFDTLLQCPAQDKEKVKTRLHELLDNRGGKHVALILMAAKEKYSFILDIPTEKEYRSEFQLKGTWRSVKDYIYKHTLPNGKFGDNIDHILI